MDQKTWMKYRKCWCPTPQDCMPCIDWKSIYPGNSAPHSSPKAPKPGEGERTPGQSSIRQVIRRLPMEVWNGEYL